ncbi:MAG: four helix bundle protein [Saprospiraceae bacterium]|nr:four helix bundle protein [Candidatus Opimibacter iunctus]
MESTYQSFEDLVIWQEGMKICYQIYDALEHCHDFGLRNQMERSAVSVPSNIAEGYELSSDRAFIRHLYIAKGSAGELRTQLYIAIRQKYMSEETGTELLAKAKKLGGMIQKFITARKKRILKNLIMNTLLFFYN